MNERVAGESDDYNGLDDDSVDGSDADGGYNEILGLPFGQFIAGKVT